MSELSDSREQPEAAITEDILNLKKGDRLPEGTFGVYEELSADRFVFAAISKYAYPPVDPETQRMTILDDGQSIATQRPTLFFGPPTKKLELENVHGRLRYNGVRIPFWMGSLMLNELGVK